MEGFRRRIRFRSHHRSPDLIGAAGWTLDQTALRLLFKSRAVVEPTVEFVVPIAKKLVMNHSWVRPAPAARCRQLFMIHPFIIV